VVTLAAKILAFNRSLNMPVSLPPSVDVLNPFQGENAEIIWPVVTAFYSTFYADANPRSLILGINPGRLGAGSTGLPFTDTKRLNEDCGIPFAAFNTHEPSSVFVYEVIKAFGGPAAFYFQFYIGSVCPLGFTTPGKNGPVNLNYYDNPALQEAVTPFIIGSINRQLDFGLNRNKIYVLGTGKNFKFLQKLNATEKFAEQLVPLEHPRFIMQYRAKQKEDFVEKYVRELGSFMD
jgi:hypothetical protein